MKGDIHGDKTMTTLRITKKWV